MPRTYDPALRWRGYALALAGGDVLGDRGPHGQVAVLAAFGRDGVVARPAARNLDRSRHAVGRPRLGCRFVLLALGLAAVPSP